jgi:SAM-dependent methyltransferase
METPKIRDHVSGDRWRLAQNWEESIWVKTQRLRARWGKNYIWRILHLCGLVPKYRGDDWNEWWSDQFDGYAFLPSEVDNAIEVGCGPYTNLRCVLERCRPRHTFLSDPLIKTYITFKLCFVADYYRRGFAIVDDHPLEELPFRDSFFDLAIMINVLDHVRDAGLCMTNIIRALKPGGWLILGQDLTNEEDLEAHKSDPGLVGHPIKLPAEWFEPWLKENFDQTLHKILPRDAGREPMNHYGTLVFAGRRMLAAE